MIKIVALDGYTLNPGDLSWENIGKLGTLEVYNRSTITQAQERAKDTEVLIVNKYIIDRDFLDYCKDLRLICISATGYNNVDIKACKKRGIRVCNVAGYSTTGVVQHTFAMLLHWMNSIGRHSSLVKKGYWSICPDFSFTANPIHELAGKKFGVLGYGDIGSQVANVAYAFGMEVQVCRRSNIPLDQTEFEKVDIDTLWSTSDVISLHASLNDASKEIVNEKSLAQMKKSAILINTSRGGLINENHLAECLRNEGIQAALLDVLVDEPAKLQHPLYELANCKITPHMAWASVQSRERCMETVCQNIKAYLNNKPQNVIV